MVAEICNRKITSRNSSNDNSNSNRNRNSTRNSDSSGSDSSSNGIIKPAHALWQEPHQILLNIACPGQLILASLNREVTVSPRHWIETYV